jgi:hypothetical protein
VDVRDQPAVPTPFDRALELHVLREAGEEYASRHGEPGSAAYRAAWLRFRQRVETAGDLRRMGRSGRGSGE